MKRATSPALALSLMVPLWLAGASAGMAASVTGSAALALAGVVAPYSPALSSADKKAVASFFAGQIDIVYTNRISIAADKIVCRTGNVDITARACELSFGKTTRKIGGREANELFATETVAGINAEGAAGSNIASLTKLVCTLDPKGLKDKGGAGAACSYEPGN